MQTIHERIEEIKLLMDYAVPAAHRQECLKLLSAYESDPIALNLLHNFYSYLPEAREDGVKDLRMLARRQGNFLLAALTFQTGYYYLANVEHAEFLGEHSDGIWEEEVLDFFELGSRNDFRRQHQDLSRLPPYRPAHRDSALCPVCSATAGELHTLGCPVEVCPWCGGQLTRCNCRFIQLGRASLDQESQLEALAEKLAEKGRIPYEPASQRPAYPTVEEEDEDSDQ
jgi:hypothetical protein